MEEQHNTTIRDQEYSDSNTQRTIIDLIDVESGEMKDANMLDTMTEAELTKLKELQSLARKSGKYKYVCAVCGQPLRLDSRQFTSKRYKSYFFSHYSNGDDCPLKTNSDAIDPVSSTIKWYQKYKESALHKNMCKNLQKVLSMDNRFSNVESYPTINIYGENIHWHKPDVAASFFGNQLVFETLMYNTFLSSIIDKSSFYRMANSFLIWLFPYFSIDNQTMCEKDVYYTHRRNIFVFDSESYYQSASIQDSYLPPKPVFAEKGYVYAQEESLKRGRLMLNCYWQVPVIEGDEIKIEWHHKLVGIEELTFDAIKKDVFFHNSDYDFKEVADPHKREMIENWERAKEERWNKIFQGFQQRKEHYLAILKDQNKRKAIQDIMSKIDSGELIPEPFEVDDEYGYKVNDIVLIKPKYKMAYPFKYGVAIVVNKRDRRGLINYRNERVLDSKYKKLVWLNADHSNILVCSDELRKPFFLYFSNGKKVVDYEIKSIQNINGNYVFVKSDDSKYGVLSYEGKVLIEPVYNKISAKDEDRYVLRFQGRTKTIHSDLKNVKINNVLELKPEVFIAERLLLYGIVDGFGHTIVPFTYSKIAKFTDKYISIEESQNGKQLYGLMDDAFKIVLPLEQSEITLLQNGCIFRKGTLYNSELDTMIEGYDSVELCPNGYYILCREPQSRYGSWKYGLADEKGKVIFPCIASIVTKNDDGNVNFIEDELVDKKTIRACFGIYVLFDENGNLLTNSNKVYSSMRLLPNGFLLVTQNGKKGIINSDGHEVIECKYDELDLDELGDARITTIPIDKFCQKSYLLDKYALLSIDNKSLTDYEYDVINPLTEGIYIAKKNRSKFLLDKTGRTIFTSFESYTYTLLSDTLILIQSYSSYGVIDMEGKIIVPIEFSHIELLPNGNLKVAKRNTYGFHYGVYGANGAIIADCIYKEITTDEYGDICPIFSFLSESYYLARQFDKYALANSKKVLLTGFLYDSVTVFESHYFLVVLGNQRGLIDQSGNTVLSLVPYEIIRVIEGNRFMVQNDHGKGIIKADGSRIIPLKFNNITRLPNNTWKVERNGIETNVYGIYSNHGKVIHECIYKTLDTDSEGNVIPTYVSSDGRIYKAMMLDKCALCSEDKTLLTDYIYDDIQYAEGNLFIVISNMKNGIVDNNGKEVLPLSNIIIKTVIDREHFIIQNMSQLCIMNQKQKVLTKKPYTDISILKNGYFQGIYHSTTSYLILYDLIDCKGHIIFTGNKSIKLDDNGQLEMSVVMTTGKLIVKECSGKYAISSDENVLLSDFTYDYVKRLGTSLLIVGTRSKYGLYNQQGEIILPLKYGPDFEMCSCGIIKFCKEDKGGKLYGLCDITGKIIAEPKNTFIRENRPGYFKLFFKERTMQRSKFLVIEDDKKFVVGNVHTGVVQGIKEYGIFVKVYGYGSGLVHIKQIRKIGKNIYDFSKGDIVNVEVIKISNEGKVGFALL